MRARSLTLLAACLLASGCGASATKKPSGDGCTSATPPPSTTSTVPAPTSSTGPDAIVRGYYNALAGCDGATACAALTGTAQRKAIANVQAVKKKRFKSCGPALTTYVAGLDKASLRQARDVQITKSTVHGDRAAIRVKGSTRDFELMRSKGRWYISGGIG